MSGIPSASFLTEVKYDRLTGEFSRRGRVYPVHNGNNGYVRVRACGQVFYGHRLAWFLVYGVMPDGEVDHINGDRSDNRISNLRLATRALNATNKARTGTNLRGVTRRHRKFLAQIKIDSVHYNLGSFDTAEEAHIAFCQASFAARGPFARFD